MFKTLAICSAITVTVAPAHLPGQTATPQLRIETRPALEMGGDGSGPRSPLLARVRTGARTKSGYAIADAAAHSFFVFDSLGRFERAVGRQGKGPGEFSGITWVGQCAGDSLVTWDSMERRLSVFSADGSFARQVRLPHSAGQVACAPNGTLAFLMYPRGGTPPGMMGEAKRVTVPIRLLNMQGDSVGTIPDIPFGDGRLFGALTRIAVTNDAIFVGTSEGPYVDRYILGGAEHRRIDLPLEERRTSRALHERGVDAMLDGMRLQGDQKTKQRQMMLSMPIPAVRAYYRDVAVSPNGTMWIADSYAIDGDTAVTLRAFNQSGTELGKAILPNPSIRLLEAGNDYLLLSYENDEGEPRVGAFRVLAQGR